MALVAGQQTVTLDDLEDGDCFVFDEEMDLQNLTSFALQPCANALASVKGSGRVAAQVVATSDLRTGDEEYPSVEELLLRADTFCTAEGFNAYAVIPLLPDESTWTRRQGRAVCVALARA